MGKYPSVTCNVILSFLFLQISGADRAMEKFVKISGRRPEEGPIPPIDDTKMNWRSYMFSSFRLNLLILFVTFVFAWCLHDGDHLQVSQGSCNHVGRFYSMGFPWYLLGGQIRLTVTKVVSTVYFNLLKQHRVTDKGYSYRQILFTANTLIL